MSWFPSFFRPSMAWLFALLVPIIVFYFLKLRRTRVEISSLALWRQVINDQRVNAPFQKFKRNLLLLLQLLLLCLIVLAAMQPFVPGESSHQTRLPILVDVSASMGAMDAAGKSRLDLAKVEIGELVDMLLPGQQIALIAVGGTARRLTEFTDNKSILREALRRLHVEDVPSRIEEGLRLTQALARTLEIERVRLYTDGNLPTKPHPATGEPLAVVDFDLPFPVDFFQIPPAGGNIGITAFNARRGAIDRWDAFLRVEGSSFGSTEADVTLKSNGNVIGQERVILGPGESQRMVFGVDATISNHLEAELKPVGHDSLRADNAAWLTLPPGRALRVFCPSELPVFRHALRTMEGIALEPSESGADTFSAYDLLISDNPEDERREAELAVFVGVVPTELKSLIDIRDEPSELVDWRRDARILQHVQLKSVVFSDLPVKNEGVDDASIEGLGYEILAYGNRGPLIVRKQDGVRLRYYFLFHTDRSTLPYRVGFPVLVSNLVTETLHQALLDELQAPITGVLPPLTLAPGEICRVTSPDGRHEERTTDDDGLLRGIPATRIGHYEIRQRGQLVDRLSVSLLSSAETSLSSVDKIHFNEVAVAAEEERAKQDRPLWSYLAMAGFCLLLFEWWYFQKKPAGIPD